MAQQIIGIGASANDGTGDPLRTAFDKVNDNDTELYNVSGWGYYQDNAASTITVNTTPIKLTFNKLGANNNNSYLPREIRGVSDLLNSSSFITPIDLGDSYDLRLDFTINAKTGSPTLLDLVLDIGGGASPTINIVNRTISLVKTPPYDISVGFPIFCLSTFLTNGGQFFVSTDTGTVDITARALFIKRDFKGDL